MKEIPTIDLSKLQPVENIQECPEWVSAAEKIREGLGAVGFIYLINHGVPEELVSRVFAESKKFFDMPTHQKMKYKKDTSSKDKMLKIDNYFGYQPPGGELLHPDSKFEIKETFDWLNKDRGVYPCEELPGFLPTINEMDSECKKLLRNLLRLLALGLKLKDVKYFVKHCRHFEEPQQYTGLYNMRLIHYPPIPEDEPFEPGVVRCGEHSDYGFITLLFQDDVGGLEVKNVDGEWIHAVPVPGSIVVNTGDLTEFWTCGIFPATPHRIVVPAVNDSKRKQSRYSVIFFNGPDSDAVLTPVEMDKRPCEVERLATNGKTYETDSVVAINYMMKRIANQYTY